MKKQENWCLTSLLFFFSKSYLSLHACKQYGPSPDLISVYLIFFPIDYYDICNFYNIWVQVCNPLNIWYKLTCKFRMHYQVDVKKNNPSSSKEIILWCNQFSFFCKHAGFWRWVSQAWLWWQPCWREQAGSYEGTCGIAGYLCLLCHGETGYPFHQLQTKTEKSKTFLQCLAMLCHFQHWMTKQ